MHVEKASLFILQLVGMRYDNPEMGVTQVLTYPCYCAYDGNSLKNYVQSLYKCDRLWEKPDLCRFLEKLS